MERNDHLEETLGPSYKKNFLFVTLQESVFVIIRTNTIFLTTNQKHTRSRKHVLHLVGGFIKGNDSSTFA